MIFGYDGIILVLSYFPLFLFLTNKKGEDYRDVDLYQDFKLKKKERRLSINIVTKDVVTVTTHTSPAQDI